MSWSILQDVPNPHIDLNGDPYSGAVLKAYLPGTTTSTSIAIDSSGSSPQASITYNAEGKLEVSGNEILPYIDRKCKWAIFANSTDAAANTPAQMGFFDNVSQTQDVVIGETASQELTAASMAAHTNKTYEVGDIVETFEFSDGNGGGARYKAVLTSGVTPNVYDTIIGTGSASNALISFVLNASRPADPAEYGAVIDADITDVLNHIIGADEDFGDYEELAVNTNGRKYRILGTVYLRKGQDLFGDGSHIFMAGTGSVRFGFKSDGVTGDSGGHPMSIDGFWMEGGNKPIDCAVSGYTIRNIFNSFASVGMQIGGSDGHISNVTVDNGTTLIACSASNSTFVNCNFFIGITQLDLTGAMRDTVFSNCVFDYGNTYGIRINDAAAEGRVFHNIRFDGCSFKKNVQDSGSFLGFIYTNNATITGDITFSNCNFRNCYQAAVNVQSASSGLSLTFDDCIFDGNKTNAPYAQSTTMYAVNISGSGKNVVAMHNCEFRNLLATPVQLGGNEAYSFSLDTATFSNNVGTVNIDIAGVNTGSSVTLSNIESGGKALFSEPVAGSISVFGYLRNWLVEQNASSRDYIEIPFYGSTMISMDLSIAQNPAGSSLYRQLSKYIATIGFDDDSGGVTQGTITETFASTSPLGVSLDVQLDIDSVGNGIQVSGNQNEGMMVISWPDTYDFGTYNVVYDLIDG